MLSFQLKPSNCLHSIKLSALLSTWNLTARRVFGRFVSLTFDFLNQRIVSIGNVCTEMAELIV